MRTDSPFRTIRDRRSRAALASLALLTSAALAGCGGGSSDKAAPAAGSASASAQATAKGKTLQAYWPLTGLPVRGAAPNHPPVIVKMDNTVASFPQVGLGRADLVTEELVEGGLTRLAVFFDTEVPPMVGPVRSMRASDIGLVKPVHGVVVTSGAARPTIDRLNQAKVVFKSNDGGAPGFLRDNGRHAPYNLMMRLPDLVKSLKKGQQVTAPYLQWGKATDFAGTLPARSITARFGSGHATQWSYAGGKYQNDNSNAARGTRFRPDTVVVVRVGVRDAGYTDPAGNFVPESVTTGGGNAVIFHGGKAIKGTWSKAGPTKNWRFKTAGGTSLTIPAGHTWIEVLPRNDRGGFLSFR